MNGRWACPVRGCSFVTPQPSEHRRVDEWEELYAHFQRDHELDEERAHQVTRDYERHEWRRVQTARLEQGRYRMNGWTLDSFPAADVAGRRALKQVRGWFEYDDAWTPRIFMHGTCGTGKTGLAYALAWRWLHLDLEGEQGAEMQDWRGVRSWNVRDLLQGQRARLSRGESTDLSGLLGESLLILDDLGAERPTDWALETIAYIVERRHEQDEMLVVTSNYSPAELAARLGHDDLVIGQRIVPRLLDGAMVIKLNRRDLRAGRRAA